MVEPPNSGPGSSTAELDIDFEPVCLSKAEDDLRIKRLSRLILACINRAREERVKKKHPATAHGKDFDEIFGLKDLSV
jgi:hypothetical protein